MDYPFARTAGLSLLLTFFLLAETGACRETLPVAAHAPTAIHSPLRVGVYINEPFVIRKGDEYGGFCIDLWKACAADLGLGFKLVPFELIPDLFEATAKGEIDLTVSGLFITGERMQKVDFSQPFLQGGLQVMVHEKRGSSLRKLWNGLRDSGHLRIFTIGAAVILLGTLLLTLGERRWNGEFHKDWGNGLAESFYHLMSIVMTGKSSHKGLPGPWGKVLAGIWIAFGVGVVAYITSSVTSVMTVNRLEGIIKGPEDLPNHRVGVITGSVGSKYCEENHLQIVTFPSMEVAVRALVRSQIDAVVHDAMTLQWYDNAHPEMPITEVGPIFDKKFYGFGMPIGTQLRQDLNHALLRQTESGFIETLRKQYFGDIP
jgi:polar amino acid transport system substrate-binding protein